MVNGMAVEWNWHKDPLAGGVDRFAYDWAVHHGIPVIPMPADWSKGRGAGMMRNADIAAISPVGIVIWDGSSTGTADFVKQMKFRGKPCIVHDLSKTEEELPFE